MARQTHHDSENKLWSDNSSPFHGKHLIVCTCILMTGGLALSAASPRGATRLTGLPGEITLEAHCAMMIPWTTEPAQCIGTGIHNVQ